MTPCPGSVFQTDWGGLSQLASHPIWIGHVLVEGGRHAGVCYLLAPIPPGFHRPHWLLGDAALRAEVRTLRHWAQLFKPFSFILSPLDEWEDHG